MLLFDLLIVPAMLFELLLLELWLLLLFKLFVVEWWSLFECLLLVRSDESGWSIDASEFGSVDWALSGAVYPFLANRENNTCNKIQEADWSVIWYCGSQTTRTDFITYRQRCHARAPFSESNIWNSLLATTSPSASWTRVHPNEFQFTLYVRPMISDSLSS